MAVAYHTHSFDVPEATDEQAAAGLSREVFLVPANLPPLLAEKQGLNDALTSIAGLTTSADQMIYTTAADAYATTALTAYGRSIVGSIDASAVLTLLGAGTTGTALFQDETAADARTTLELGSLATLSTISNTNWSGADLAIENGGTGASSIEAARTNLGLGTAATADSTAFATAAQGLLADSAVQPGDGEAVPAGGTTGQVLAKASATDGDTVWTIAGQGDIISTNNGSDFADPAAVLDNLDFLQSGAGAVARSASDKLADFVSVKDFGAIGDGVTDDTAAIQAAFDAHTSIYMPAGSYVTTSAVSGTMSHRVWGAGRERTKVIVKGVAATATTNVGFEFINAAASADRYGDASVEDMSLIRDVETGGRAIYAEGQFNLVQKFVCRNVRFRGNSASSASPYYFDRCILTHEIRFVTKDNILVYGNIDVTLDPAGQAQTVAFEGTGNGGQYTYIDCFVGTMYTALKLGDSIEGFYIFSCNFVNVVDGLDGDTTVGEPGGWIKGLHVNAVRTAVSLANRTAMNIEGMALFRSDGYFEVAEWVGLDMTSVSRSNFSNIQVQPQPIGTADVLNIRMTSCQAMTMDGLYLVNGVGLTLDTITSSTFDNIVFHSCAQAIDWIGTGHANVTIGATTFLAMNRDFGVVPTEPTVFIEKQGLSVRGVATEAVINSTSTTTVNILAASQYLRYFADVGAGAYTHNIDLRNDLGVSKGDVIFANVRFAASANPTVRFRNGAGGSLVAVCQNSAAAARTIKLAFVFDGTNWLLTDGYVLQSTFS